MEQHVYKTVEIVGTSAVGIEDAVQTAMSRASKSLRNIRWFEIVRTTGRVKDGTVLEYQVTMKVGFTLDI